MARQDWRRKGVRSREAIELGLGQALFNDGRRLLQQLCAQTELWVPGNTRRPGEKAYANWSLQIHSICGLVELHRNYFYAVATGTAGFPLDEALGLVESFSPF